MGETTDKDGAQRGGGLIPGFVWGWGQNVYGAMKWAVSSIYQSKTTGEVDEDKDIIFAEATDDTEGEQGETPELTTNTPIQNDVTLQPDPVQEPLVGEKTGKSLETTGTTQGVEDVTPQPKQESVSSSEKQVQEPEPEKEVAPTFKSVQSAWEKDRAGILSAQRATGDDDLRGIIDRMKIAGTRATLDVPAFAGLLKEAKSRAEALDGQITREVKNLERQQGELKILFNREVKRLGRTGPGAEERAEYEQNDKLLNSGLTTIKLGMMGPAALNLTQIDDFLSQMRATIEALKLLAPQDEDEAVDENEDIANSVTKREYPFGGANKIPHIHNYGSELHLKYFDGSTVKRINLIQNNKRYEDRITEALNYADTYTATATQRKLKRVLEAML